MGTDIHGVFQRLNGNKWEDVPSEYEQNRHYFLFAWLGNVRNGFGFAGIPTHTAISPLSDCRGFPSDFLIDVDSHPIQNIEVMDKNIQSWHRDGDPLEIWMGDHSHSWVSADEVINTKPPTILRTGIVGKDFFDTWDGVSSPESWSGDISGPNIVVSDPSSITSKTTHVRIEWFDDASESLKYFIDEMKRLKEQYGNVRFVFGFDS